MSQEQKDKVRSNFFVMSFQMDGVCLALRQMVAARMEPGPLTRETLKLIRQFFVEGANGTTIEFVPEVTDD